MSDCVGFASRPRASSTRCPIPLVVRYRAHTAALPTAALDIPEVLPTASDP